MTLTFTVLNSSSEEPLLEVFGLNRECLTVEHYKSYDFVDFVTFESLACFSAKSSVKERTTIFDSLLLSLQTISALGFTFYLSVV